jgi:hypothetical protein
MFTKCPIIKSKLMDAYGERKSCGTTLTLDFSTLSKKTIDKDKACMHRNSS